MSESQDPLHTARIRCNYCSKRIPASSIVCPNCQRNPRAFYWKRGQVALLVLGLVIVLGAAAWFFGRDLTKLLPASVALNPTASPSPTPRRPITVILVATARPSLTATRVPPTNKPANTATASPTLSPTPTVTLTQAPRKAGVTDTPSPVPTAVAVPAPKLVSPADGERVIGASKHVFLQFQPAQTIRAQEWYRVQVDYLDRAGNPSSWCEFTQDSQLEFPREFFDDSSPNVRSFLWRVNVVHSNQVSPKTCDAPYETLSAASEVWTFYWY